MTESKSQLDIIFSAKFEGILILLLRVPDFASESIYPTDSYPPKRPVESQGRILIQNPGFFALTSHLFSTVL